MLHASFHMPNADGAPIDTSQSALSIVNIAQSQRSQASLSSDEIASLSEHCLRLQGSLEDLDVHAIAEDEGHLMAEIAKKYRRTSQPRISVGFQAVSEDLATDTLDHAYAHYAKPLTAIELISRKLENKTSQAMQLALSSRDRSNVLLSNDYLTFAYQRMTIEQKDRKIMEAQDEPDTRMRPKSLAELFLHADTLDHAQRKVLVKTFLELSDQHVMSLTPALASALQHFDFKSVRRMAKRILKIDSSSLQDQSILKRTWKDFFNGLCLTSSETQDRINEVILSNAEGRTRKLVLRSVLPDGRSYKEFKVSSDMIDLLRSTHDLLMVRSLQRHEVLHERVVLRAMNVVQGIEAGRALASQREFNLYRDNELQRNSYGELPASQELAQMQITQTLDRRLELSEARQREATQQQQHDMMLAVDYAARRVMSSLHEQSLTAQEALSANSRQLTRVVRSESEHTRDIVHFGNAQLRNTLMLEAALTREQLGQQITTAATQHSRQLGALHDTVIEGQNHVVQGINQGARAIIANSQAHTDRLDHRLASMSSNLSTQYVKTEELYSMVKELPANLSKAAEKPKDDGPKKANREVGSAFTKGNIENIRASYYISKLGTLAWKIFFGN